MRASMYWLMIFISLAMFCSPAGSVSADEGAAPVLSSQDHRVDVEAWRARRHQRLLQPDGWLTLVGLEWLTEGKTSIGSSAGNDIQLPRGPDTWGVISLRDGKLTFSNYDPASVAIDGESREHTRLVADTEGEATVLSSDGISVYAIFRQSYALRIKDAEAPALKQFQGVDNYPIDESWRITGDFTRADEGRSIEIANVLGQINEEPIFGEFSFVKEGRIHSLIALEYEGTDKLWIIFSDRTSGHGTYGAGRYVYSEGPPVDGKLIVDFNKAYNPPCAFNPWATCPIPPQQNRMDLHVTAGEKDFHPHAD